METPQAFMQRIRSMCGDTTLAYITTCVNAPAIDHIYLFRETEEVDELVTRYGFSIRSKRYVPYAGKTLEFCRKNNLAINVAYFLDPV